MRPERRAAVATGCQTKQRRVEQPVHRNGKHSVVGNLGETKAYVHGRLGDDGLERSWLDLHHVPLGNAGLKTKDAARVEAHPGACQRLSVKLRLQRLCIRAAVKRRDSALHDVNVHAPGTVPKAAALNEKATVPFEEALLAAARPTCSD